MLKRALVLLMLMGSSALAKDISLPLSDADQSNVRQLCVVAVKSPQVNAEGTEQFVTFCAWVRAAMERAAAKPQPSGRIEPASDPPDSDPVKRSQ